MATIKERSSEISRTITFRFFEALDKLVEDGVIKSRWTVGEAIGANASNFYTIESNGNRSAQLYMLSYIVSKFKVNGDWLLTGNGDMFRVDNEVIDIPEENLKSNRIVTDRFLEALDILVLLKKLESPYTVLPDMGYVKSVYPNLRNDDTKTVNLAMCYELVRKYKIKGTWLLSGIGAKI